MLHRATLMRFRYDRGHPKHRVSTTFCRIWPILRSEWGSGGRGFKSHRPDSQTQSRAMPALCVCGRAAGILSSPLACGSWHPFQIPPSRLGKTIRISHLESERKRVSAHFLYWCANSVRTSREGCFRCIFVGSVRRTGWRPLTEVLVIVASRIKAPRQPHQMSQ